VTTIGGFASYVELLTCLEMARDANHADNNPRGPKRTNPMRPAGPDGGWGRKAPIGAKCTFRFAYLGKLLKLLTSSPPLRAGHKPTFSVQIAKQSRLIVIVERTVGQAGTLMR
jgi:hypothetical protein